MSAARRQSKPLKDREGIGGVAMVEEALHLLRQAPAGWWVLYLAGVVPWLTGLLWVWSRWVWLKPTAGEQAWLALLLVGLFFWLKGMQSECAARLLALRHGRPAEPWSWRRWTRRAQAQFRLQAWGLVVLPAMAALTLPFGWVMAYYQSATVLGDAENLDGESRARAMDWPGQNHLGLLWVSLGSLIVWVNLATCFYLLPWLANRLLGIENLFATRGILLLNSTFLLVVTMLAWMAVDPLIKAFYTLRIFYGQSRREASDLRVELRTLLAGSRAARVVSVAFVALVLAGSGIGSNPARAAEGDASRMDVSEAEVQAAIDRALQQTDFKWNLQPLPPPPDELAEKGWMQDMAESARDAAVALRDSIRRTWRRVTDWLDSWTKPDNAPVVQERPTRVRDDDGGGSWLTPFLYIVLFGIVLLLGWLVWLAVKRGRMQVVPEVMAAPSEAAVPDLRDERVHAAQLPWDRWLQLARECMDRGEWRLAWRALFLAQLARLAAEDWLRLDPAKTNLTYERELARNVPHDPAVVTGFRGRRQGFERVWYGRAEAGVDEAEQWWTELRQTPAPSAPAERAVG
ncbi:hypothetical protein [Actomonas aquatica]|uniref:DUF4129 domain-containing protein n=1 Tax=Actomonas aquatica TaxID=2866162 RepID=A0ABZ1C4S9_9BACT|nr:hypothetical protein [Opitutus sp. WL0086]WRQ86599.1 hypothetical protein K1X11_017445 [Opitutus sp. WL0086]